MVGSVSNEGVRDGSEGGVSLVTNKVGQPAKSSEVLTNKKNSCNIELNKGEFLNVKFPFIENSDTAIRLEKLN